MENKKKSRRKYTSIPLHTKLNVLQKLNNEKCSIYEIADELGVDHTTIRSWRKNEKQLKEWLKRFSGSSKKSKRMRQVKYQFIDNAVWLWFKEKRATGIALTGPNIQDKAKVYYKQLGVSENFCASNGWLWSFKERYGLKYKKKCEEQLSFNQEIVPEFKQELLDFIKTENLNHHQIFNCNKTGLNYRALLESTFCEKSESHSSSVEGRTERITVMACSNVSGTCKLPLVVVGKWTKPYYLQDIEIPVLYKNQKSAWMTSDLCASWYETEFIPYVKGFLQASNLPPKALLLIDDYFSHSKIVSKDGIIVKCFPVDTTSLIQPIEYGCLQNLKLLYKEIIVKHIIDCIDNKMSFSNAIQQINLRSAVFWLANAWKKMDVSTIQKSWDQVWLEKDEPENSNTSESQSQEQIELLLTQFLELLQNTLHLKNINMTELKAWFNQPYLMTADECLTDDEILQITREENDLKDGNNDTTIDESGEEYCYEWKEFNCNVKKELKSDYGEETMNINYQENIIEHSTLTKKEADLCFQYLYNYCRDNNYPRSIIVSLDNVKIEMDKYNQDEL